MKEKRKFKFKSIIFIIIIIFALLFVWARYINTKGLNIKEYAITNEKLPNNFHGLKIIHFSDIHFGQTTNFNDLEKIVKKINELKPDVVFFTGDLFNNNIKLTNEDLKKITKELKKIKPALYKYAISGDADLKNYNEYKTTLEDADFILLNNSNELLYYKGTEPIKIVGLTDSKELDISFKEENIEPSFSIVLIHESDNIDNLSSYRVDMAFAGHSLGGQIKVPFLGGIIKKEGSEKYIDGYYKVNDTDYYVSSGIGTENLKLRVFNKPSINLYRIYNK
ncbi:MAG: metallophosphoesterase [Bacilli bacterium]|nr:metallophosphoesterase [Bacilli bacterium]